MNTLKPTLWTGAHPDDTFIGGAITIRRNAQNAQIITTNTGVIPNRKYPIVTGGITVRSTEEYVERRLEEDRNAMRALGINLETQYTNLQIHDLQTHLHIERIVEVIKRIAEERGIERIVTHEVPQSHPDHEVVSFCAHYAAQELGLEVWEYPMYGFDPAGKEVSRQFLSKGHNPIVVNEFTPTEAALRSRLIRLYRTQDYIETRFRGNSETFGRINRDFRGDIPVMKYLPFFYEHSDNVPSPEKIRDTIGNFLDK